MYLMNITKNEPNRARADLVTKKLRQFLYQNKLQALIIFFFLLISVFQRVVFCLLFLSTAKQRKVNNVKNAYINTVKCSGTLITYTIITILETSYYRTKQCVLIQYFKKNKQEKELFSMVHQSAILHSTVAWKDSCHYSSLPAQRCRRKHQNKSPRLFIYSIRVLIHQNKSSVVGLYLIWRTYIQK